MAEPERPAERPVRFESLSGIPIDPLYSPASLPGWSYDEKLGRPGEYPFTRGVYPTMYRGRLWTCWPRARPACRRPSTCPR